jgi:hypothetical protein
VYNALETLADATSTFFSTIEDAADESSFAGLSESEEQIDADFRDALATFQVGA